MNSTSIPSIATARFGHVCLTGVSACTCIGLTALTSSAAVRAGISGIGSHSHMRDKAGEPFAVGMVPHIVSTLREQRLVSMARMAVNEAMASLPPELRSGLVLHLGLPDLSESFTRNTCTLICGELERLLADEGTPISVHAWPYGNASSLLALQQVARQIEHGEVECALVGGVDSYIDVDILEALDQQGRVASSSNKWGFQPGEGAAVLVVCQSDFAQRAGLNALASVRCVSTGVEDNSMHSEGICVGKTLGAVFAAATETAGQASDQYCDIDGDRYREHEFSYAILRIPGDSFRNATDYVAPADCWGNCGAATAALLTTLCTVMRARGAPVGSHPMIWCGSESGHRAAMVLHV